MTQPVPDRRAPAPLLPVLRFDARRLALLGGLALATVALLLALGGGRATLAALRQVDGRLLLLAAAVHYAGFALRGYRWQALLAAVGHRLGYRYTTGVLLAGWFVSALLPARAGDAFRIAALRLPPPAQPAVPAADSLGSIVLERTLDILALLLLSAGFGLGVLGLRLPGQVWAVYGGALLLLSSVALAALLLPVLLPRLRRRPAHPLWQRALDFTLQVVNGLRRLPRRPVWGVGLVGESLLIWLCDALLLWLAAASLGYGLPISVAGFTALTADIFAAVPLT
ncbi:MAG TPA: lysylphosphatidylglycerol synthase domain-containing protein, partial [Caldilineaceae bacterium]|nr:lysylphosphatidylglycerol synthase domain-containing protein [Caldilineaceae bacterium]